MRDALRAGGGIVVRDGCLLVVHRPKYDDWTWPKGKLKAGESWEDAALREVEEETSLRCSLGPYVGSTHYELREGRKEVRYFLMTSADEAAPKNEIDAVRFVTRAEAQQLLSYDYDRDLLARLTEPGSAPPNQVRE